LVRGGGWLWFFGVLGRRGEWQKIEGRILASEHTGWGAWHGVGGQKKYVVEYSVRGTPKRVELKQVMGLNSFKMISPKVGSSVPLLFNPRSGKVDFDIDDPQLAFNSGDFLEEDSKTARDAYKSALKGRPGRAMAPAGGETDGGHRSDQPDPQLRRARVALREARRNGDPAEVERLTAELERLEHGNTHARSRARSAPEAESIEQRLARLQQLRDHGVITPEEFTTQRQRILDSL
jgi:Short C-terminal domain